jgi:hypothetical protein
MLIMSEDLGRFPDRSDEVHALIRTQLLELRNFGLNLGDIRLVGARQHVQLLLGSINAALLRRAIEQGLLL